MTYCMLRMTCGNQQAVCLFRSLKKEKKNTDSVEIQYCNSNNSKLYMKAIEEEIRMLKTDYGDKISTQARNKIDKYLTITREMAKFQIIKPVDDKQDDKTIASIKVELQKLRCEVESEIKLQMTDHQAYIWKLTKMSHKPIPQVFTHLTLSQQALPQPTTSSLKAIINTPLLSLRIKDLIKLATEMLMTDNKYCSQNYTVQQIAKLITQIAFSYNILPYHHFTHAFSVFLMFMQCRDLADADGKAFGIFSEFQIFVTAIAALVHDMGHQGTNNQYQTKKNTRIALIYNYESVLQNMHISYFYKLCKEHPDLDIISKMKSPLHRENAKRLLMSLILATDVQGHAKNLKKLQILAKKETAEYSASQKELFLENIFHGCDVGNPCLQFGNYMNWSILISEQFNVQVEKERNDQLDVSQNIEFVDLPTHYRRQLGFIDFIVMPLWKEITRHFPSFACLVDTIEANREKLKLLDKSNKPS